MNCPQCQGPFKDPTTFPCGHSCCLEEAKQLSLCCVCNDRLNPKKMKINIFMREIAKYSINDNKNEKNLLQLLECPICFVPYIDPTTFPCGHSCCIEEARLLSCCPLCSAQLPEKMSLNSSMNEIISSFCSNEVAESSNDSLSQAMNSLNIMSNDTNENDEESDVEEEAIEGNDTLNNDKKKKKRKNKKKKKITNDQIEELYSKARFKYDKDSFERLQQLTTSNNMLALSFMGALLMDPNSEFEDKAKSINIAERVIPWLEENLKGNLCNDKYFLFLSGVLNYNLHKFVRGLQQLKRSALLEYPIAQFSLGSALYEVFEDPLKAIELLKSAAANGIASANKILGDIYETKLNNIREAFKYFKLAADGGDRIAQTKVGYCYNGFEKDYVTINLSESARYFRMAADQGNACAQYNISKCYMDGTGVPVNVPLFVKYLKMSAEQNYSFAQFSLGLCYLMGEEVSRDTKKAEELLKLAAAQGHANAATFLAEMYHHGDGAPENKPEAFKYYKIAADNGNANAQYNVSLYYEIGEVNPVNQIEAFKYLKMASDQSFVQAYPRLAECYLYGKGVALNEAEGIRYCHLAWNNGQYIAYNTLGCFFQQGVVNHNLAFQYFKLAADQGVDEAQLRVGACYHDGQGVAVNCKEALKYWKLAAAQGVEEAYTLIQNSFGSQG